MDEADVRHRCRVYSAAFPGAEIAYAGKAFLCRAMAGWIAQEGLSLDTCSAGELAVVRSVSFPADRIVLHGNAKTPGDLAAAVDYGVGRIVIDSASEIIRLAALSRPRQRVLIRVTPGVDAHAHPAVATGVEDQKFGFPLSSGAAADAVRRVLTHPELELVGLHCHLGSQITQLSAFEVAARRLLGLMADMRDRYGIALAELNLGGGHAVPYVAGDEDFNVAGFARVAGAAADGTPLLEQARKTAVTAAGVVSSDTYSAFVLAYDAARFACIALLAQQGLRATTSGGHYAVEQAVRAQFGDGFRPFGALRRRRNELEYPRLPADTATSEEAEEAAGTAQRLIDGAGTLLPQLSFFSQDQELR